MLLLTLRFTASAPSLAIFWFTLAVPVAMTSVMPRQPAVRIMVDRFTLLRSGERTTMIGLFCCSSVGGLCLTWTNCGSCILCLKGKGGR